MIYVNRFKLPSEKAEWGVVAGEHRTIFNTFYPFKIFPQKQLSEVVFDGITLFYGGNGSGKSTLINVISSKMNSDRYSDFNGAPFFEKYVDMCYLEYCRTPTQSCVLTSDDVFDYVLNARSVNDNINNTREQLVQKYIDIHKEAEKNPEISRLKGLYDYERWSETREILSPKRSQSKFIKKRVAPDIDLHSNGETAMRYFVDRIDEDGVYFLDEPENSLSVEFQLELADYIAATARATNSQFIIATHSPIFLAMKNVKVYNLDACPVEECKWTELPNVRKYFDFFMERKSEFE